ncbi:hypothetical protein [Aureivirga marina]|uniref:hypothetical protein n=1 Tax=Aureivirga marina TaxID=1182451 RepID=UPI0018CA3261|nr:hypothetical protein [Aureivirga marina]
MTNKRFNLIPSTLFQLKAELENIKEQIVSLDANNFYDSNSVNDIRVFLQNKAMHLKEEIEKFEMKDEIFQKVS